MKIDKNAMKAKAQELRKQLGGRIFVFPVDEADPFSEYAFVTYAGGKYLVYPESADIGYVAQYVLNTLEIMKKHGIGAEYDRDVRLVSYEAQVNAPNITMRRLRKESAFLTQI